ncbi:hypothetical protein [Algoriphagus confluentis]|uniref:Uncharacterized protein n=1 Tax=Algoriphagus confluentis TaxID=1697556 RepID=A0ABQ6PMP2_9BACT|nr:hypothetical protein Aconfl_18830 [Algoriphagus confluentis]
MTPSQTNEQALESTIEKKLTGSYLEELKELGTTVDSWADTRGHYQAGCGYCIGSPTYFDALLAIDEVN